ncbi:MAG: sigma-70 family RNA polymerase sigma factor [Myxococcota bacterium]
MSAVDVDRVVLAQCSDEELVEQAAHGDAPGAFGLLARRHQGKIRSLLLRLTRGNTTLAEDLAQETFLRAYRGLGGFEGRAQFGTWLHRIAYFVYLNHRNRSKTHASLPEEFETTAPAPDDECSAHRADLRRDVSTAVSSLPPRYRRVVMMHFVRHVPYRDIADTLGVPLGTVKTQLHRAKLMMRDKMSGWGAVAA